MLLLSTARQGPVERYASKVSLLFFAMFRKVRAPQTIPSYLPRLPSGACRSLPPVYRWAGGLRVAQRIHVTIDVGVT